MDSKRTHKHKETLLGESSVERLGFNEQHKPLPDTYKVGRDDQLQLSKIERDLFTDMEEKESGNYIISGLSKQVTELDFTAFSFAIGQILYNQSYQSGNTETNSGISKKLAKKATEKLGSNMYNGEIVTSLNDLCRLAYGVDAPDQRQKKTMSTLVDTIHKTPVVIQFPNGDTLESSLCVIIDKYTRAEDGAVLYNLYLNPIFCSNVERNFGELPQDITKRLSEATKKKTTAHYRLLRLLSIQAKGSVFTRTIDELIKELGLAEAYRTQRVRTEKQLLSTFDTMKEVNIIDGYKVYKTKKGAKETISKVTFTLSAREKMLRKGN